MYPLRHRMKEQIYKAVPSIGVMVNDTIPSRVIIMTGIITINRVASWRCVGKWQALVHTAGPVSMLGPRNGSAQLHPRPKPASAATHACFRTASLSYNHNELFNYPAITVSRI